MTAIRGFVPPGAGIRIIRGPYGRLMISTQFGLCPTG